MRTCLACRAGRHSHCEGYVPRVVDPLGIPVLAAGFVDCSCICAVRGELLEKLREAQAAIDDDRLDDAIALLNEAEDLRAHDAPRVVLHVVDGGLRQ